MPINTLQKRGRQIGEIRIGIQVQSSNGRMRPAKLDTFRFTTKSPTVAQAVAAVLGGTARAITLLNGESTHEVVTDVTELPVMVPPGDAVISQWFELWSAGGCQRRCDGETEQRTQTPCMCPQDPVARNAAAAIGQACKPVTRLNVMLPDLPDLGVWKLASNGYNAAVELGGAADVLRAAREAGVIVPAVLRLEQRQSKRITAEGESQTRKFAVPVLEIGATLRNLTELAAGAGIAAALPPAPARAIEAAPKAVAAPKRRDFDAPQQLADAATNAATVEEVLELGKTMQAKGWAEEYVDDAEGVAEPLREFLLTRHAEVTRAAGAQS